MSERNKNLFNSKLTLIIDALMIYLVVLDICLVIFNSIFDIQIIRESILRFFYPTFTQLYSVYIYQNFLLFEVSIFTTIFAGEFLLRWFWAIRKRSYKKWYFYPIYHWYDLFGFIPTSTFRLLRLLRIFVFLYKLHRSKLIDLNKFAISGMMIQYYRIIVEEVSDRVAVNLLEEAKSEIQRGEPMSAIIVKEIVKPHRNEIADWAAAHVRAGITRNYKRHRGDLQKYLKDVVKETVETNKEVGNLEKIPVFGAVISESIHKAVADIAFGVLDRITYDLASEDKSEITVAIAASVLDLFTATEEELSDEQKQIMNQIICDTVDLVIKWVKEKKWKLAEQDSRTNLKDILY